MSIINQNYELKKNTESDINQHLETLKNYAAKCQHITEMGVRGIVSTWALLAGKPKTFKCYDISVIDMSDVKREAEKEEINFQYINAIATPLQVIQERLEKHIK
jgi:hypothetical protein